MIATGIIFDIAYVISVTEIFFRMNAVRNFDKTIDKRGEIIAHFIVPTVFTELIPLTFMLCVHVLNYC